MSCRKDSSSPNSGANSQTPANTSTQQCTACTISSQTVSTARTDRTRTNLGVGERATLTVTPAGSYTWSVSGGGTLSATSGNSVDFIAGDRASTSVITATSSACSCSITLRVWEPSGAYQVQFDGTLHQAGTASSGFMGTTYLEPTAVSFENIEVNEGTCAAVATGIRASDNGKQHPEWPAWASVGGGSGDTGSVVQGPNHDPSCVFYDFIFTNVGSMRGDGSFRWDIPWRFRVNGGSEKVFTTLIHNAVYEASGKVTMSKGGVTVSSVPSDQGNMP